jgi:hypothetical protein
MQSDKVTSYLSIDDAFFFFLVAPTRGSLLPLRSIGLSFLSFLI